MAHLCIKILCTYVPCTRSPYLLHQQAGKFVNMCRLARAFAACILIDFSFTVNAATLIFISGRGKEGKSGSIYNLVKNK